MRMIFIPLFHFCCLIHIVGINVAAVYDFLVAKMSCHWSHCKTAILTPVRCGWEASNENYCFECSIDRLMDNILHGRGLRQDSKRPAYLLKQVRVC